MSGTVFIISAPSGSGKTTLANMLRESVPDLLFSVSYTTRKKRGSEQDGREYYFVDRQEFERMLTGDEFLEHANVYGNYYGTAKRFLKEAKNAKKDLLLDIDVQGEEQVKRKIPAALSIFILPPSREILESRLRARGYAEKIDDKEANVQGRLLAASKEIEKYRNYDYILVNDQLDRSIDQLKAIVLSERLRHSGEPLSDEYQRLWKLAEPCLQKNAGGRVRQVIESFASPAVP